MAAGGSIGRYQLLNPLGRGGFATVFRALDTVLDREVAVKILGSHLAEDDRYRLRFLSEGRLMARLHHPNIVAVFDVGEVGGRPFYAMELIEGTTVADLLAYGEQLAPEQMLGILHALAGAIDYLHATGVVHRDVKASNIMVDPSGRLVLMDFGIARMLDDVALTQTNAVMGTPESIAPELARGEEVGPAADVYALGVLAYRMLAGRPPFVGNTAAVLRAHAFDEPISLRVLRPGLPSGVYNAVSAALAKMPDQRPRTAAAFVNALERALNPDPLELTPTRLMPALGAEPPQTPPLTSPVTGSPISPSPPLSSPALPATPPQSQEPFVLAGPALDDLDSTQRTPVRGLLGPQPAPPEPPVTPVPPPPARRPRRWLLLAAVAAVLLAVGGGAVFALTRGGSKPVPSTPTVAATHTATATAPSGAATRTSTAASGAATRTTTAAATRTVTATRTAIATRASTVASRQPSAQPTQPPATQPPPAEPAAAPGTVVGDLDLNVYCRSQNASARLLPDNTWACAYNNNAVQRIDANAACQQQYQRADVAAQPRNDAAFPTYRCVTT